jgi:hypothetical protein
MDVAQALDRFVRKSDGNHAAWTSEFGRTATPPARGPGSVSHCA